MSKSKMYWTLEMEKRLEQVVHTLGTGNWPAIASEMGVNARACRDHWHFRTKNLTPFSEAEDRMLIELDNGSLQGKWKELSLALGTNRPCVMIKNRVQKLMKEKRLVERTVERSLLPSDLMWPPPTQEEQEEEAEWWNPFRD
jgi:hypothetical protein